MKLSKKAKKAAKEIVSLIQSTLPCFGSGASYSISKEEEEQVAEIIQGVIDEKKETNEQHSTNE